VEKRWNIDANTNVGDALGVELKLGDEGTWATFQAPLVLASLDGVLDRDNFLPIFHPLQDGGSGSTTLTGTLEVYRELQVLPVPEVASNVTDSFEQPSKGFENSPLVDLIDLGPVTSWPLLISILSQWNCATEKGIGMLAGVIGQCECERALGDPVSSVACGCSLYLVLVEAVRKSNK
jgi:hypothetical protein